MTTPHTFRALFLGLAILGTSSAGWAQQEVDYPALGLRFEVPAGWQGQEGDGMYLIQKPQEDGILVLMPHEATTLAELEAGAREGLHVADGSSLDAAGQPELYGTGGVRIDMTGLVEWAPVEAHAIGLLSPHGGPGVAVLAIAPRGQFTQVHRGYAETVAESIVFSAPETPPIVDEWARQLVGRRLARYNTQTSGYGYEDSSSDIQHLTLCDGYFHFTDHYSGVGGRGVVSVVSNKAWSGTWSVTSDVEGTPILSLVYEDGSEATYELAYEDGKTYLNGTRWLRVDGECQ